MNQKCLPPHMVRVVDEKRELDEKRTKLLAFIQGETFKAVDEAEQARLKDQWEAMTWYSTTLGSRIEAAS